MLTTQKSSNCEDLSEKEVQHINKTFLYLQKEAVDYVHWRLGGYEEFTGSFVFDEKDSIYADMKTFDAIKESKELTGKQKQYLLKREFNGVRPNDEDESSTVFDLIMRIY
jgi:hypothetical protein